MSDPNLTSPVFALMLKLRTLEGTVGCEPFDGCLLGKCIL